jgi:modulator of FtsH protease
MPYPNDPAAWQNFYVMMGSANAALTGLVFVALSIHLREVLEHPILKPRAVVALVVLATQIVIAAIVLTPQSSVLMGWEILVLNVVFVAATLRQGVALAITPGSLVTFVFRFVYTYAAISLILGVGGGFYVLALVLVLTLGRTMASCWALLTALEPERAPSGLDEGR